MSVRGAFVKVKPSAKPDRMYFRQTPKPLQETGTWTPQPHNVSFAGGLKTIQQVGAIPRHGPICRRSCRNTIWLPTTSVLPVDIARNAHNSMAASRKRIRTNRDTGLLNKVASRMRQDEGKHSRWCHRRSAGGSHVHHSCNVPLYPAETGRSRSRRARLNLWRRTRHGNRRTG